ncbi:MAG: hypothetical protein Kow0081_2510 [Candidatus Dojkabacteria bacterium]
MSSSSELQTIKDKVSSLEAKLKELELLEKYDEIQTAWNKSLTRVFLTSSFTYFVALISMLIIEVEKATLNALIPSLLYILSFQSIPFVKKLWIKWYLRKNAK